MHRIHLNIGSNQGDSLSTLGRAAALIASEFPGSRILLSDYVTSEPWGFESTHDFLNRGLLILTEENLTPHQVLERTQAVETAICPDPHRNPDGSYRDRVIDIDIIDFDHLQFVSDDLVLPHPRAALRQFVTLPMAQLDCFDEKTFWHGNCYIICRKIT